MKCIVAVLLAVAGTTVATDAPAVQAAITQKALDFAVKVGVPMLERNIKTMSIAAQPFDQDSFKGSISNIQCSQASIGQASLSVQPGKGVGLSLGAITISCRADWKYKEKHWPHVPKGHGSVDITIEDSSAGVDIALSQQAGKPHVAASNCAASIHIHHFHFHGGLSGAVLNLLKDVFHHDIEKAANKAVCHSVLHTVNDEVEAKMAQFPTLVPLPVEAPYNISEVDFSLTDADVGGAFIGVKLHGEVYRIGDHQEADVPAPQLPAFSSNLTSHMVELVVAPYLLESAAFVYWKAGLASFTVDSGDIPPSLPFSLNTKTFQEWAPAMYSTFPNQPMALNLDLAGQITTGVAPDQANVTAPLNLTFAVETSNGTVDAFRVSCPFSGGLTATVNETTGTLAPNVTYLACPITLSWSRVGTVHTAEIRQFVNAILSSIGIQSINKALAKGMPLPTFDGISLVNTTVQFGDGFLQVLADAAYTPPPSAADFASPKTAVAF